MSSMNIDMAVKSLVGDARLFADELDNLRALINHTREVYVGLDLKRVDDVVFDFIHLSEEGDIAKIKVLQDGVQRFMAYVDYRADQKFTNTMWWIYNVDGELTMRRFDMDINGVTDECFQQFIIDVFPHLA